MAEGSRAAPGGFNASSFQMAANDHGDSHTVERTERSLGAQEKFSARDLPRTMLKVLDERLTHRLHQRQHHFLAALLRANADARVLPVQIIQKQFGRRNTADAIGHHQNDERVVSGPDRCVLGIAWSSFPSTESSSPFGREHGDSGGSEEPIRKSRPECVDGKRSSERTGVTSQPGHSGLCWFGEAPSRSSRSSRP